jgi:MFS transporter, FSR family, fosmidomycin resistance protein
MSDIRNRRLITLAGGLAFGASLLLTAVSPGFWLLLASFVLFYPASGAFVSLSQAEMMDRDPGRRDQNMARWTFAGSAGAMAGPLALGAALAMGNGWRLPYLFTAALSLGVLALSARFAFPTGKSGIARHATPSAPRFRDAMAGALRALKRKDVLRWLALLELANLMLDVLFGFLALYFVEVVGVSTTDAAFAVTLWTASEVAGDLLLIPLIERLDGMRYLRWSAAALAVLFPIFLLAGPLAAKLVIMTVMGLLRAGWYAILQARLYECLPGRSGVALALGNIAGLAGALIPLGLGALAQSAGLPAAMWALLAGPLALLVGLPRKKR